MTNSIYKQGSVWRKWDLHVHTPNTALNDGFSGSTDDEKWERWLDEVESGDVKAVGVTDYFSIDNYKKVINYKEA
jgi:DNA repair protein SbcC/Rad50